MSVASEMSCLFFRLDPVYFLTVNCVVWIDNSQSECQPTVGYYGPTVDLRSVQERPP